jgi:hypothetical protein
MKTIFITLMISCAILFFNLSISAQESLPKNPPARIKEVGLGFSNFNNFSLQYRWGTETRLYRLSGTIGGSTNFGKATNSDETATDSSSTYVNESSKVKTPVNINASLNFSILQLKPVTEKFGFLYGVTFGVSFNYMTSQTVSTYTTETQLATSAAYFYWYNSTSTSKTTNQTIQPNLGIALGGYYKITPAFWLYAEIDPNIYYAFTSYKYSQARIDNFLPEGVNNNNNHTHDFGVSNLSNSLASLTLVYRFKK